MRQTHTQRAVSKKWGKNGKRFASAALAACLTLFMSVSIFASIGSNGGSVKYSVHMDEVVHFANAGALPMEDDPGDAPWTNLTSSRYRGTVYVKVGETVTVHLLQRGVSLFGEDGLSMPQWYGYNGRDFQGTVGIKSNLDGTDNKTAVSRLKVYKPEVDRGYDSENAYCMEMQLTGKRPGTEYFYYEDGGHALEGAYYKVVVTSDGSAPKESKQGEKPSSDGSDKNTKDKQTDSTPTNTTTSGATYTVQAGDTLAKIALNAYGDMSYWPQLQEANREALSKTKDGFIYVGMSLNLPGNIGNGRIPPATAAAGEKLYTVKAGDTYGSIAQAHFGDASRYKEIWSRNSDRIKDVNTLYEGQIIVLP